MIALGALVTFLGFLISVISLSLAASPYSRLVITTVGILISLFGILGVLNYVKRALWRK